jgi:DNA-damage-inducible protein J
VIEIKRDASRFNFVFVIEFSGLYLMCQTRYNPKNIGGGHDMSRAAMIHARMEPELKQDAESIFRALGMTTTEAVTLFYKQVKMRHGLPFTVEIPDEELDTWQREEIKKGLEEMRTGKLIDHSDVVKRWAAR